MPVNTEAQRAGADDLSPVKRALIEIRQLRAELEESKRALQAPAVTPGPVAILGMAMRFPGGVSTPERFWQMLANGEDLIGSIPPERWDAREYLNGDPDHPGTMYDGHGGFLPDIYAFDAEFFGINPREAAAMDPQQRLLLQLAWEALERAAIDPGSLSNTSTGVFLGLSNSDYARYAMRDTREIDAYTGVGSSLSIAAGRISYFLGSHGPAMVVDTACSSSLVALHLAVESLRRGEIDLALVGAANLVLTPEFSVGFSRARMLSRDGRSKTFDAAADGYVRSEGCGVVVLKRLADARRDGDPVLANIAGTAVNQDGRSAGITAPNGPAQEAVMRAALLNAGVAPASVSFIEAHGTGTPLGDPMEVRAIAAVYCPDRDRAHALRIGSVKTNLGHTEAAAGIAGLIKVVLMMQPGHRIPPDLHFRNPNPNIDWANLPIEVPATLTPWAEGDETLYAGLSSFGFSGTNAHVIIASADRNSGENPQLPDDAAGAESRLLISARDKDTLRKLAESYVPFLLHTRESFVDICFTALTCRGVFGHKLSLRARSAAQAAQMLELWLAGNAVDGVADGDTEVPGWQQPSAEPGPRRVTLPVYPFRPTRYWVGPVPREKRRQEGEQIWQAAVAAAQNQSLQGPLGWKIGDYAQRWQALHRLTLAHARNTLANAGAFRQSQAIDLDEAIALCGFKPLYRNLVSRWLDGLVSQGTLSTEGGRFHAGVDFGPVPLRPYWAEAERQCEDNPALMAYLRQCGALLGDVLTGGTSALETLFPQGSFTLAEGLYETSPEARYLNPIVAAAVDGAVRRIAPRRNARVLEIGGGTGGTTSAVLSALPETGVDYWFTDVSDLFLNRAMRKFASRPFLRYALFDLDQPPDRQGFSSGFFDIILGANAVHAARDLAAALRNISGLLAPGGLLVMLESTQHHGWFDMTTGLIEGWQHFEDELRQGNPLLRAEQWRLVLGDHGFSSVLTFPGDDSPVAAIGQHVVLARAPDEKSSGEEAIAAPAEWKSSFSPPHLDPALDIAANLRTLPPPEREAAMFDFVRTTIRRVFGINQPAGELTVRDRLTDLGMDSLIALELKSELAKGSGLGTRISSTIAFDTGTVGELTAALLRAMEGEIADTNRSAPEQFKSTPEQFNAAPAVARTATLSVDELSALSDEEVEKLLNERLTTP